MRHELVRNGHPWIPAVVDVKICTSTAGLKRFVRKNIDRLEIIVNFFPMEIGTESDATVGQVGFDAPFQVLSGSSSPEVLIVCEHASHQIPEALDRLGLSEQVATSHIAWDPGALGVALALNKEFASVLFHGTVSRLVYDCNRPPEAETAIPERSEVFDIPGNHSLEPAAREARVLSVYKPFTDGLAGQIARHCKTLKLMVTVHSFTPVFHGVARDVEIGVLHGRDADFAQGMMANLPAGGDFDVRLNEPYAASDGVAHTLDMHGAANDLPSAMIEIRNDLIETPNQQEAVASYLSAWLKNTLENFSRGRGQV